MAGKDRVMIKIGSAEYGIAFNFQSTDPKHKHLKGKSFQRNLETKTVRIIRRSGGSAPPGGGAKAKVKKKQGPVVADGDVIWFYQGAKNWHPYTDAESLKIQNGYKRGQAEVKLQCTDAISGKTINLTIDLKNFRNVTGKGRYRHIRSDPAQQPLGGGSAKTGGGKREYRAKKE